MNQLLASMEEVIVCKGHLYISKCKDCIVDENNKYCPNYMLVKIKVDPKDIKREPTSIDNRLESAPQPD